MGNKNAILDLKSIFSKFKGEKSLQIIIFIGIAGIALLFLSELYDGKTPEAADTGMEDNTSDYQQQAESKLTDILSGIDGIGNIKVMITFESTKEYVYAQEEKASEQESREYTDDTMEKYEQNRESESEYLIVEEQSGSKNALIKKIIQPKVQGVLIVCEEKSSAVIEYQIITAVSKLFGISSDKVCVI